MLQNLVRVYNEIQRASRRRLLCAFRMPFAMLFVLCGFIIGIYQIMLVLCVYDMIDGLPCKRTALYFILLFGGDVFLLVVTHAMGGRMLYRAAYNLLNQWPE
jgi:hypothetical protein